MYLLGDRALKARIPLTWQLMEPRPRLLWVAAGTNAPHWSRRPYQFNLPIEFTGLLGGGMQRNTQTTLTVM
jgi:hypothetical protein